MSLSLSQSEGTPSRSTVGRDRGEVSFEFQDDAADDDEAEAAVAEEEEEGSELGGAQASREILVLQRVPRGDDDDDDDERLDRLMREKESLADELSTLRRERDDELARHAADAEAWRRDELAYERTVAELEAKKGTRLEYMVLEAEAALEASRVGYEHVAMACAREQDELAGALQALEIIARGLQTLL